MLERGKHDDELAALVVLLNLREVPIERLAAEPDEFGSAVAVLQRVERESILAPKFGEDEILHARMMVADWQARGLDVRAVFDRTYPSNLRGIFNKPPLVFVRGTWREDRDTVAIAVVGTRKPTDEGRDRAAREANTIAAAGITVISGLAAGIDTAAHTAALDAGGRTVAVMGTGIDLIYPSKNTDLAKRIVASGGALLSQFFPDQPATQWTFPMRNVVMSGLSLATLVIEATETSGARMQARIALQHGRSVFLLSSLVRRHEWARKMVEVGYDGVRAVQIESADEVVNRLLAYDVPAVAVG